MWKVSCVLVLLLIINFGNIFVIGKSSAGGAKIDEENAINKFSGSVINLEKYYSDALVTLTESIQSEFQKLKAQVARLEDRVERHDTFMNDSIEEIKRQLQTKGMEKKKEFQVHGQNLPSRHCPEGFNYSFNGAVKCYAVLSDRVDWNTAQIRCRELNNNAQLVVINSSREQEIITQIMRNKDCLQENRLPNNETHRTNGFWIGAQRSDISDCYSSLQWKSNNGATFPIQYNNWVRGEPNCGQQREACASMDKYHGFKWNDLDCTWSVCPLCEVMM